MLSYVKNYLDALEGDLSLRSREDVFASLRALGLDDFGEFLLAMPDAAFPRLSSLLPKMASDQIQRDWTGNCGIALLKQSLTFVRSMSYSYTRLTGQALDGATVLDYGCGYGRIARLMYALTPEANVWGVDPWDRSIAICRADGMGPQFTQSDYLPSSLPVGDARFDLIYAFSVFTHLSKRATLTSLRTLRKYIKPGGLLVITIRPEEYWAHDVNTTTEQQRTLLAEHRNTGFAFSPHHREAIDGDVTYGDTSMTLDWLTVAAPEWMIDATDRSLEDSLQRYVYLKPRPGVGA